MEQHVKQNDKALYDDIQRIGCFFRSCGLVAEYKTGKRLNVTQINNTWDWAKNTRRIDGNNNVRDSASIINRFLRVLGDNMGSIIEVGTFKDGKTTFYPYYQKHRADLCRADFLIQKIRQNGPSGTHFRLVDKLGNLIEDPHEPVINVKGIEYSILYAYAE